VVSRKRNLAAVAKEERLAALRKEMQEVVDFIQNESGEVLPFKRIKSADKWLWGFEKKLPRYAILIVFGPSHIGKTEWVKALFTTPLTLEAGTKAQFPTDVVHGRRRTSPWRVAAAGPARGSRAAFVMSAQLGARRPENRLTEAGEPAPFNYRHPVTRGAFVPWWNELFAVRQGVRSGGRSSSPSKITANQQPAPV
jgi:hypothetical protein